MNVCIKENSLRAKIAARFLKQNKMAVVFNKTVYLHNTSKNDFLKNEKWVRHELQHIYQYQQMGCLNFLFRYMIESIKKGYHHNQFEIEAREKENENDEIKNIHFIS